MTAAVRIERAVSKVNANDKHWSIEYPELRELLQRNERWAKHMNATDPSHYPGQRPEVLWIGCELFAAVGSKGNMSLGSVSPSSWGGHAVDQLFLTQGAGKSHSLTPGSDARVPETMIMGSQPGDIFVHRGIANLYTPNDDSLNAVLMIALINFKVKHIIVAGHSNCVGCQTALRASLLPPVPETQAIQRYLKPLTVLARNMATEDGPPSLDLLVEENVAQQVNNLLASQIVQDDWKRRGQFGVTVHGWVYQLENGIVRDLGISQGPPTARPGGRRMGVRFFSAPAAQ